MESSFNPYQSPQSPPSAELSICYIDSDPSAPVLGSLVLSSVLFRHVQLKGRWHADLIWSAMGIEEFVQVNGQRVAAGRPVFRSIPHFSFAVESSWERAVVEVDVRVAWVYFTRAFRIRIGGVVVYQEGKWNS